MWHRDRHAGADIVKIRPLLLAAIVLLASLWGSALFAGSRLSTAVEAQGIATSTRFILDPGTVSEGAIGDFQIRADSFPDGLAGFEITVDPVDSTIARVVGFDTPTFGIQLVDTVRAKPGGMRLSVADLQNIVNPGDQDVLLATVRIEGLATDQTDFTVSIWQVADEAGFPFQVIGVKGLVTVTMLRDLDGDGLTEDCNGNGLFDFADINCWFDMLITP